MRLPCDQLNLDKTGNNVLLINVLGQLSNNLRSCVLFHFQKRPLLKRNGVDRWNVGLVDGKNRQDYRLEFQGGPQNWMADLKFMSCQPPETEILKVSTSLIVLIYWLRPFNPASFSKVEERAWEPSYSWLLLYLGDQFWVLQIYSHRYQICWRTSPFLSSSSFLLLWGKRETTNK